MTKPLEDAKPVTAAVSTRPSEPVPTAPTDVAGQVARLLREIEAVKAERATLRMRIARARLGVAHHVKRAEPVDERAEAA